MRESGLMPQGRQAGRAAGDHCSHVLDTNETRRQRFQDHLDFEALFQF